MHMQGVFMTKLRQLAVLSALLLTVALASSTARADQIFIQQSGTSPAGGDPNLITNTGGFMVGIAGNHSTQNPLIIIVGVYNGSGTPAISFSGCTIPTACPAATAGTYGINGSTASFTASSTGSAFDQFGLASGGSESFVNWSAADVANGFAAPTSFSLYAFEVPSGLTPGSPLTIDESGAAFGSFIIAYSCNAGTGSSSGCAKQGDIAQTVFTNTGLITSGPTHKVPEPSGLALLGSGLVLAAGLLRRRLAGK